jgi:hypothetical protein
MLEEIQIIKKEIKVPTIHSLKKKRNLLGWYCCRPNQTMFQIVPLGDHHRYSLKALLEWADTLQKLRVGDRCLINIISMMVRHRHDIVMKIDSTSLSLNLNMLIRCLFVINRSDVESTLNNDVENTLCRYRTDIENIYFDTSRTCTDIESTLKNCRPDTSHTLYRYRVNVEELST